MEGNSSDSRQQTFKRLGLLPWGKRYSHVFKTGELSDANLKVITADGDKLFKVHKWILRFSSDFFESLFYSTVNGSDQQDFTITVDDVRIFELFLQLLYCDHVTIYSVDDAISLYIMADKYLSAVAVDFCYKYLKSKIDTINAGKIFTLAMEYGEKELESKCRKIWCSNTKLMLTNKSLNAIDLDLIVELFNEASLTIDSELDLFKAILANDMWLQSDPKKLSHLLKKIRFLCFDLDTFLNVVVDSGLMDPSHSCAIMYNINNMHSSSHKAVPMPEGYSMSQVERGVVSDEIYKFDMSKCNFINNDREIQSVCIMLNQNMYLHSFVLKSHNYHSYHLPIKSIKITDAKNHEILREFSCSSGKEWKMNQSVLFCKNTKYFIICNNETPNFINNAGSFITEKCVKMEILLNTNTAFSNFIFKKTKPV